MSARRLTHDIVRSGQTGSKIFTERVGSRVGIPESTLNKGLADTSQPLDIFWWRGEDLNLRPSGYEPDELPDCSTPRQKKPTIRPRPHLVKKSGERPSGGPRKLTRPVETAAKLDFWPDYGVACLSRMLIYYTIICCAYRKPRALSSNQNVVSPQSRFRLLP